MSKSWPGPLWTEPLKVDPSKHGDGVITRRRALAVSGGLAAALSGATRARLGRSPICKLMLLLASKSNEGGRRCRSRGAARSLRKRAHEYFTGWCGSTRVFRAAGPPALGGGRHLRTRRSHGLAHASAGPDIDRYLRLWMGAERRRPNRGSASRRHRLVSSRRKAVARRHRDHGDDPHCHCGRRSRTSSMGSDLRPDTDAPLEPTPIQTHASRGFVFPIRSTGPTCP